MPHLATNSRSRLAGLLLAMTVFSASAQVDDSELKAAFVYNFAVFTTWPDAARAIHPMLSICTQSNVGPPLQRALRRLDGKPVQDRNVRVVALGAVGDVANCDIVVLGIDGLAVDTALRAALSGHNILTICDCVAGDDAAIISIVQDGNRLGFAINREAAAAAGLSISSKILSLARKGP